MTGSFRIAKRTEVGRAEWDAFADASDDAWLWHRYDIQEALETWRGSTDESFALSDREGDQIVAIVPLRRTTRRVAGFLPMYFLDVFGGVAVRNTLGDKKRRAILTAVRDELVARSRKGICLEIRIALSNMTPALRGAENPRVNPLLEMGCDNTLTQSWVIDLRAGTEAVWKHMEGRARTAIRKAQKCGVQIREARQDDLETYYLLHEQTYRRTGVIPHPKDYFRIVWERFVAKGLAHVWIAELDGEPVAAENFGIYKQAAVYWTGAANAKGLEVEANSLLQWTAMQWMLNSSIEWYETGEAFPQFGGGKQKGLNDFKKSFGGDLYPYYKGRLRTGRFLERLYHIRKGI